MKLNRVVLPIILTTGAVFCLPMKFARSEKPMNGDTFTKEVLAYQPELTLQEKIDEFEVVSEKNFRGG